MFSITSHLFLFCCFLVFTTSSEDAELVEGFSEEDVEQLPQAQALVNGEHSDLGAV